MSTNDTEVKEFKDDVVQPYRGRDQRMPEMEDDDGSQNDQTETSPQEDTSFITVEKGKEETQNQETSISSSDKDEGWEDRYSHLRTFSDRKITELSDEIQRLKSEGKIHQSIPVPSTEEEVQEWMEKYPDTAGVIESIIINKTQEVQKPLEERLNQIETRERKVNMKEAEILIKESHSDYLQLQDNDHFKDWIRTQPDAIVGCLTAPNQFDAFGAIRAIDLYKSDLLQDGRQEQQEGVQTPREPSAADHVPTNRRVDVKTPQNKKVWTTSQIGKLKPHEFDKLEQEIDLARSEGRVVQG